MTEFKSWKEREEEATYTTYVKSQQTYHPHTSGNHIIASLMIFTIFLSYRYCGSILLVCCRSGKYCANKDQRKTKEVRPHQKESRKLDSTCISRLYVNEHEDGRVSVKYISAHTHELGNGELKYLPLPESTKQDVATKISLGVPAERILEGNKDTSNKVTLLV